MLSDREAEIVVAAIQSGEVDAYDLQCLIGYPAGWVAESKSYAAELIRAGRAR